MPAFSRSILLAWLLVPAFASSGQAQIKARPVSPALAPPVIPATIDVITFDVHSEGEDHKLIVMPTPALLRVDAPSDGFSVIYDPQTEHYTGLENRNYTYWEFSWPEVKAVVESSKRYETRLHDMGTDGMSGSSSDASLPPADSITSPQLDTNGAPPPSDDSGYVWRTTPTKKQIADLDCTLWMGDSVSNGSVQAWCYAGPLPRVQTALAQLRVINDPIALVPVRNLVPSLVFQVNDALMKGGVTPLLITWGDEQDKNRFELTSVKTREGKLSLFTVPKLYVKTTLVTMDGMGNQKPPENKPTLRSR